MYVVIMGGGKVGEYLATVLLNSGNDVALIENDLETADKLSIVLQGSYLVIHGDGCDSKYQEDAGIRRADVFVAATGQDDNNLVSCEIAQRVFSVPRCIARVNHPQEPAHLQGGRHRVRVVHHADRQPHRGGDASGSVSVASSLTHGNVVLTEIRVPRMRVHSNETGVRALDMPMPENSLIVAVSTTDDVQVVGEDTYLMPGDTAIIAADNEVLDEVRSLFRGL